MGIKSDMYLDKNRLAEHFGGGPPEDENMKEDGLVIENASGNTDLRDSQVENADELITSKLADDGQGSFERVQGGDNDGLNLSGDEVAQVQTYSSYSVRKWGDEPRRRRYPKKRPPREPSPPMPPTKKTAAKKVVPWRRQRSEWFVDEDEECAAPHGPSSSTKGEEVGNENPESGAGRNRARDVRDDDRGCNRSRAVERPQSVPLSALEQITFWRRLLDITQPRTESDEAARTDALPGHVVEAIKRHGYLGRATRATGSSCCRVSCASWRWSWPKSAEH